PADSLWRRERRAAGPALRALASGAVVSAAVLALPSVAAQGSKPGGARFAVAGAVTLTGVVSFLMRRPGQLISDNARANRDRRGGAARPVARGGAGGDRRPEWGRRGRGRRADAGQAGAARGAVSPGRVASGQRARGPPRSH